jgi:hypothetical protein
VILNNPFYFILFIPFANSLTQNTSIYSQYIVYEINGIGDRESVNTTISDVRILSEAFLNMFLRSASFIESKTSVLGTILLKCQIIWVSALSDLD